MLEKGIQLEKAILELEQNLDEQNSEEWTNKDNHILEFTKVEVISVSVNL